VMGAVVAAVWAISEGWSGWTGAVPVLGVGWVTCLLASPATAGWAPVIGAPMLAAAIAPEAVGLRAPWAVPAPGSVAVCGAMARGASVWTVIRAGTRSGANRPTGLGSAGAASAAKQNGAGAPSAAGVSGAGAAGVSGAGAAGVSGAGAAGVSGAG